MQGKGQAVPTWLGSPNRSLFPEVVRFPQREKPSSALRRRICLRGEGTLFAFFFFSPQTGLSLTQLQAQRPPRDWFLKARGNWENSWCADPRTAAASRAGAPDWYFRPDAGLSKLLRLSRPEAGTSPPHPTFALHWVLSPRDAGAKVFFYSCMPLLL